MLKNKHLLAAMFVAPILSIGAYFATDYMVTEQPHVAQNGAAYPLIAKSKCRYESGRCEFNNGDVDLVIHFSDDQGVLFLESNVELNSVEVAFTNFEGAYTAPRLALDKTDSLRWSVDLSSISLEPSSQSIRLVATASQGASFYGESELTFALEQPASNHR